MTRNQFDVLTYCEKHREAVTQRKLSQELDRSLGTVNKALSELTSLGYIQKGAITQEGILALEPYRVQRAVFIAAGFGSRLVPITLNTPKPLVRVNGVRIIDTMLDAMVECGIEEIYIIRGYFAEQFDQLLYKYPTIKFIENPIYNETNNISSAMCARALMENAYVCEADILLYNPALITKYQYCSNYLGVPTEKTDDWCFTTNSGYITKLEIGGVNCHEMMGISYWTKEDGQRLREHIKQVYEMPGGKERFWDVVPLEYFQKYYKVAVRECKAEDIVEIDTFRELKLLDSKYRDS
ncbi:NTP transferase domain-containing protein [Clostridia bacterium OttesenSCG-928-F22]|nr:NTP transferase domain-containing protein [Clostridia bacterium OttesenSCG-928-F22]